MITLFKNVRLSTFPKHGLIRKRSKQPRISFTVKQSHFHDSVTNNLKFSQQKNYKSDAYKSKRAFILNQ